MVSDEIPERFIARLQDAVDHSVMGASRWMSLPVGERELIAATSKRLRRFGGKGPKSFLLVLQEGRCLWCGASISEGEAEIDHLVPLALGGTNRIENLAAMHKPCNATKGHEYTMDESPAWETLCRVMSE